MDWRLAAAASTAHTRFALCVRSSGAAGVASLPGTRPSLALFTVLLLTPTPCKEGDCGQPIWCGAEWNPKRREHPLGQPKQTQQPVAASVSTPQLLLVPITAPATTREDTQPVCATHARMPFYISTTLHDAINTCCVDACGFAMVYICMCAQVCV